VNRNLNRGNIMLACFGGVMLLYIVRLLYLQVLSEKYALKAQAVDMERVELYPSRGIIYDRNDKLYVKNSPIFDVMFLPNQITIPDTSILEKYLGLTKAKIKSEIAGYTGLKRYQWQPLMTKLSSEQFGSFSEHMWKFDGIKVVSRPIREYNYHAGAHFLGYLSKADSGDIKKQAKEDDVSDYPYNGEDLIGKVGIEAL